MQAQTQISKGELLLEIQGKTVTRTIKEVTPHGIKMEMNDEGQVTGKINGNSLNTINVFLKPDGTNELESKGLQSTREGDMVFVRSRCTGHMYTLTYSSTHHDVLYFTVYLKITWYYH